MFPLACNCRNRPVTRSQVHRRRLLFTTRVTIGLNSPIGNYTLKTVMVKYFYRIILQEMITQRREAGILQILSFCIKSSLSSPPASLFSVCSVSPKASVCPKLLELRTCGSFFPNSQYPPSNKPGKYQ